jgi:uncharacterized protein (TIGR02118 family)
MVVVSVMYPKGATFNRDYYLKTHMPMVRDRWRAMGLKEDRIFRAVGAPGGGEPPYQVVTLLTFDSLDNFQAAAAKHGGEIFADIPKFTNGEPMVQINEPLE